MIDVVSPVTGVVWKIEKQTGDTVAEGEVILILESMKMEIPVEAPGAGRLSRLDVIEGDSVTEGDVIATVG